jgi:solute carrier family 1 (neuronal/epithelial high affinity glutamate transporter), member 1
VAETQTPVKSEHDGGNLTLWIVIAIVLAIVFALLLPWTVGLTIDGALVGEDRVAAIAEGASYFLEPLETGGKIFLDLLKMMVVPLVITSVMSGILSLGDVRKLGRPGLYTIAFYLSTTVLAVLLGIAIANVINPGKGLDREQVEKMADAGGGEIVERAEQENVEEEGVGRIVSNLVTMLFTDNLVRSAAEMDLLPLIVFSIVFAGMLTTLGERVDTMTKLIEQANDAILQFVLLLMRIAPLGIFCLVAGRFGRAMVDGEFVTTIVLIAWYSITVLVGLGLHAFVTLPLLVWFLTKRNPYLFMWQMSQALLTAFSTASSSATLPVTMECATQKAGVKEKAVEFVTPLGATINMDGTALYEAVAVIFIAQFLGQDLTLGQQLVVALTATLAAIGAAGIPEAGLVTMLIVLNAVGLPLKYQAVIIPVDWLLDRFRTAINVFGDACGAAVIEGTIEDEPAEPVPPPKPEPEPAAAAV